MYIQCPHCESYLNIREIYSRCTECKELINQKQQTMKELLTKTQTMNKFKKGDKVFVAPYGWCEYCEPSITVRKEIVKQGCNHYEVDIALVSFTEYKLEGFTQERPFKPVINENYFFWNDGMLEKHMVMYGKFIKYQPYEKGGEYVVGSHAYKHISETNPLL